jgi:hypothetical protein
LQTEGAAGWLISTSWQQARDNDVLEISLEATLLCCTRSRRIAIGTGPAWQTSLTIVTELGRLGKYG